MKREEWVDKLQEAWNDVNDMQMHFENVHFYEEEGETSDEAREYIEMVKEEIEDFSSVLAEVHEKLEKLEQVIDEEKDIEE